VATGVWPIVSMRTFLAATGPKTDLWLVKTVGALITVIGAALLFAGLAGNVSGSLVLLGSVSAAALGTVDVNYVSRGIISKVYLVDAAVEAVIVLLWLAALVL
jgi:hypothetical protein